MPLTSYIGYPRAPKGVQRQHGLGLGDMLRENCTKDLVVNGKTVATRAGLLSELLAEQELANTRVATAVNGQFVSEPARSHTKLKPGDRIEIVSARQGG